MTTATTTCHCARCRLADAGLGPGPYTPAEYARIAPATVTSASDDPVSRDPAVLAAQLQVREAREAYEPFEAAWLEAVAAHLTDEMAPISRSPMAAVGCGRSVGSAGCGAQASWPASARTPGRRWSWRGRTW
jgi:hypothetical protein